MTYDFSGYATKHGVLCSDGRTITAEAFKHMDGQTVPLVWQHQHNDPNNVLGQVKLEYRDGDVYGYASFNSTDSAKVAKDLVQHGDISSLSIYANKLVEKTKQVLHGNIREVSLVLSGANPGAVIDNIVIAHGDGYVPVEDEAIMYFDAGLDLAHADDPKEATVANTLTHEDSEETVQDVFDTLTDKQKDVVYYLLGSLADDEDDAQHDDSDDNEETLMHKNIFTNGASEADEKATLSHADMKAIMTAAARGGSLKEAFLAHAGTYGIDNIEFLFPDAKTIDATPSFIKRRTDWVAEVMNGTRHTPFSRIKSVHADITEDAARAKGFIKGNLKKEEVFKLLKRVTGPTTVYKKQKIDRDDMIDITDFDVVVWLKAEMRLMLDEEIARAVLIGDGRDIADEDKINEECIRPIAKDADLYSHKIVLADRKPETIVEASLRARSVYEGSGNPTFFTTSDTVADMLLDKLTDGRRRYPTMAELETALRASHITEVPVMQGQKITLADGKSYDLVGIMVNMRDYVIGADKGGAIGLFDDFDIDYNQYKYLIETRCSGALDKPKSALVFLVLSAA